MTLRKYCVLALVVIVAMLIPLGGAIPVAAELASGPASTSPGLHTGWMTEEYTNCYNVTSSYNRTFEYYVPSSYTPSEEVPLLFSFHGLGSNGDEQRDLTRFDVLAEREGFIAVFPYSTALDPDDYPEAELPPLLGAEKQWNLGAGSLQYYAGIDDVAFVSDMVNWFEENYDVNTNQIYSTGMSDGALFSYLLAFNLTGTFAAIAPVCGPMPWGFDTPETTPLTVILMHGTDDPILAYDGYGGQGGNVTYSVDETVAYWCAVDDIDMESPGPEVTTWGPTAKDPTSVTRYVYSGGTNETRVILFKVDGGGHCWPGGPQYLGAALVGLATTHIDGSGQIWKYLSPDPKYYLRICSTYDGGITNYGGSVTTPGEGSFFYYPSGGEQLTNLVAEPKNSNYEFASWTGDVSTIGNSAAAATTITVTPDKDYEIFANFQHVSAAPPEPTPTGGCFIATAAYGTSTARQLDVLRSFRDNVLLKSTIGSRLVDIYYRTSPPIADFISRHEVLRTLVRELLIDPIVWLAQATENMWQS
jgi:polyhydroxybutyrate depolymerase